jgi:hypothetical protein
MLGRIVLMKRQELIDMLDEFAAEVTFLNPSLCRFLLRVAEAVETLED